MNKLFLALPKLYKECAKKSFLALKKHWLIIPASVLLYIIFNQLIFILMPLGLGGGLLVGLFEVCALTLFYYWIAEATQHSKITTKTLLHFDYSIFFSLINAGFIFFIAKFLLGSVIKAGQAGWLLWFISLAIFMIFNALPEIIIKYRNDGMWSLTHAYNFILANWVEWFIPPLVIGLPWLLFDARSFILSLSQTDPLFPAAFIFNELLVAGSLIDIPAIIVNSLSVVIVLWFMVFRVFLFESIENGFRRKAMFLK